MCVWQFFNGGNGHPTLNPLREPKTKRSGPDISRVLFGSVFNGRVLSAPVRVLLGVCQIIYSFFNVKSNGGANATPPAHTCTQIQSQHVFRTAHC